MDNQKRSNSAQKQCKSNKYGIFNFNFQPIEPHKSKLCVPHPFDSFKSIFPDVNRVKNPNQKHTHSTIQAMIECN